MDIFAEYYRLDREARDAERVYISKKAAADNECRRVQAECPHPNAGPFVCPSGETWGMKPIMHTIIVCPTCGARL